MDKPRSYSFDPAKNAANIAARGIDFAAVERGFEFDVAVVATDDRRDYGEVRKVAVSFIGERLHVLVFTMRGDTCHVISLRKANRREIGRYEQNLEG